MLQALATEVMVARMEAAAKRPRREEGGGLACLLAGLGVAGQGGGKELLGQAREKLGQAVARAGQGLLGKPALSHRLEEEQWQEVARIQVLDNGCLAEQSRAVQTGVQEGMAADYSLRRLMLLAR